MFGVKCLPLYVLIERAVGSLGSVTDSLNRIFVDEWKTKRLCTFISTDEFVKVQFSLLLALHSGYGGQQPTITAYG